MVHKDDQMTPKQRSAALKAGQSVDRMPIALFFGSPAPGLMGWTRTRAYGDPESMAQTRCKIYEPFGCDNVGVEYGLHGINCGVPCVVGREGIERVVELPLTGDERAALNASVAVLEKHTRLAEQILASL